MFQLSRVCSTVSLKHQWGMMRCSRSLSTSTSLEQKKQDHNHCVQLVQERDKEGYLCGLLMPSHCTKSYFALKAFNAEIAAIKDSSSSQQQRSEGTLLAHQLRMQWWMDALNQIYDDSSSLSSSSSSSSSSPSSKALNNTWHSPIVRSLHQAHQQCHFTRRFLERLIESRRADLEISQYETMDDLIQYAEDSVSTFLYLSLEMLGVREDAADEVAYHAGVGIGLVTALRSIPYNLQVHENLSVPSNILMVESSRERNDLILSLLAQGREDDSPIAPLTDHQRQVWDDAVQEMVSVASLHLSKAQQLQTYVPRNARVAFLPVVPALLYLSHLQGQAQYNVFDPILMDPSQRRLKLLLLLSRTWLTGVF